AVHLGPVGAELLAAARDPGAVVEGVDDRGKLGIDSKRFEEPPDARIGGGSCWGARRPPRPRLSLGRACFLRRRRDPPGRRHDWFLAVSRTRRTSLSARPRDVLPQASRWHSRILRLLHRSSVDGHAAPRTASPSPGRHHAAGRMESPEMLSRGTLAARGRRVVVTCTREFRYRRAGAPAGRPG